MGVIIIQQTKKGIGSQIKIIKKDKCLCFAI
jgi:hypothetical protein